MSESSAFVSGELGQIVAKAALARAYEVVGFCRAGNMGKPARFGDRITVCQGRTNERSGSDRNGTPSSWPDVRKVHLASPVK